MHECINFIPDFENEFMFRCPRCDTPVHTAFTTDQVDAMRADPEADVSVRCSSCNASIVYSPYMESKK